MKIVTLVTAAAMAAFLMGGAALADSAAPAPAPAATAPAKAAPAPMSAASIECSKEADAKGLHGTARKKFRAECKKNAAK
jgi:psiF repeat